MSRPMADGVSILSRGQTQFCFLVQWLWSSPVFCLLPMVMSMRSDNPCWRFGRIGTASGVYACPWMPCSCQLKKFKHDYYHRRLQRFSFCLIYLKLGILILLLCLQNVGMACRAVRLRIGFQKGKVKCQSVSLGGGTALVDSLKRRHISDQVRESLKYTLTRYMNGWMGHIGHHLGNRYI